MRAPPRSAGFRFRHVGTRGPDVSVNWIFMLNAPTTGAAGANQMSVRFATAQALFETFPELSQKISAKPSEHFPTEFLQTLLAAGKIEDAVTFCSYLLPRRE